MTSGSCVLYRSTNYLYDGDNSVEEIDLSSNVVARYAQTLFVDDPLAEVRSGVTTYYEADGINSITSLTNAASAIVGTYAYDAYGNLTASAGTLINPFRYTGRELDPESNLYFYRTRYFDTLPGRFISEDSIGFAGGVNFYRYVENNPVIYVDAFGMTCHCTYHQRSGAIQCTSDDTGKTVVNDPTGYSGHGPGYNNPDQQNHKYYPGVPGSWGGPIPVGSYGIGPPTTAKGPLSLPLIPLPGTNTFGRDGFLIHGDNSAQNHSASEGCIVLPRNTRQKIADCEGGTVQVVP